MEEADLEHFSKCIEYLHSCYHSWVAVLDSYDQMLRTVRHLNPVRNEETNRILCDFKAKIECKRQQLDELYLNIAKQLSSGYNVQETEPFVLQTPLPFRNLLKAVWPGSANPVEPVDQSDCQFQKPGFDDTSVAINSTKANSEETKRIPKLRSIDLIRENYGSVETLHRNIVRDIYNVPRFMVGFNHFVKVPVESSRRSGRKSIQFRNQETQTDISNETDRSQSITSFLATGQSGSPPDSKQQNADFVELKNSECQPNFNKSFSAETDCCSSSDPVTSNDDISASLSPVSLANTKEAVILQSKKPSPSTTSDKMTEELIKVASELKRKRIDPLPNQDSINNETEEIFKKVNTEVEPIQPVGASLSAKIHNEKKLSKDKGTQEMACINFLKDKIKKRYGETSSVPLVKLYGHLSFFPEYRKVTGKLAEFSTFLAGHPTHFKLSSDRTEVSLVCTNKLTTTDSCQRETPRSKEPRIDDDVLSSQNSFKSSAAKDTSSPFANVKVSLNTLNKWKYKTELCYYFSTEGHCLNQKTCQFAHGDKELLPKRRTKLCPNFLAGRCSHGCLECHQAHGSEHLGTIIDIKKPVQLKKYFAKDISGGAIILPRTESTKSTTKMKQGSKSRVHFNSSDSHKKSQVSDILKYTPSDESNGECIHDMNLGKPEIQSENSSNSCTLKSEPATSATCLEAVVQPSRVGHGQSQIDNQAYIDKSQSITSIDGRMKGNPSNRELRCAHFLMDRIKDKYGESTSVAIAQLYTYLLNESKYEDVVGKLDDFPNFIAGFPQYLKLSSDRSHVTLVTNATGSSSAAKLQDEEQPTIEEFAKETTSAPPGNHEQQSCNNQCSEKVSSLSSQAFSNSGEIEGSLGELESDIQLKRQNLNDFMNENIKKFQTSSLEKTELLTVNMTESVSNENNSKKECDKTVATDVPSNPHENHPPGTKIPPAVGLPLDAKQQIEKNSNNLEMECAHFLVDTIKKKYGISTPVPNVRIYGHLSTYPEYRKVTGKPANLPSFLDRYPQYFQLSSDRSHVSLVAAACTKAEEAVKLAEMKLNSTQVNTSSIGIVKPPVNVIEWARTVVKSSLLDMGSYSTDDEDSEDQSKPTNSSQVVESPVDGETISSTPLPPNESIESATKPAKDVPLAENISKNHSESKWARKIAELMQCRYGKDDKVPVNSLFGLMSAAEWKPFRESYRGKEFYSFAGKFPDFFAADSLEGVVTLIHSPELLFTE